MKKLIDTITAIPLFYNLPADQLNEVTEIALEKYYPKGQSIFMEGDEATGFFVIVEGMVKVFKVSFDGKEQILHILGPAEPFAEVPVFAGLKYPAHAEAIQESYLLYFPRAEFVELIKRQPSLAMNMLAALSLRLRQFAQQVEALSLKEVPGRLAAYLLDLSDEQAQGNRVSINITKKQLAGLLGTIPETISRILTRMKENNLIELKDREVTILDRPALVSLTTGEKMRV
ncbi:MAG: Crp/Fnr family transcriptional regulator [Deltaproteobacteria bacterium]|nr:Crp/Fnr family transcriptional regulator [Deltaproteobacteria bacterium]